MKNLILPFLVVTLLSIGACDDSTITPPVDKEDTTVLKDTTIVKDTTVLKDSTITITEDILFIDKEKDSTGREKWALYGINVDGGGRRLVRSLPDKTRLFTISPDKKKVLFTIGYNQPVYLLEIAKAAAIVLNLSNPSFQSIRWFPDGKLFTYINNNKDLFITDGFTNTLTANDVDAAAVIDDNTVMYSNSDGLVSSDKSGGNKKFIYQFTPQDSIYHLSAITSIVPALDGNKIAFTKNSAPFYYMMNKDGSGLSENVIIRKHTGSEYLGETALDWSPDGKDILISSRVHYIGVRPFDHYYFSDIYISSQFVSSLSSDKEVMQYAWSKNPTKIIVTTIGGGEGISIFDRNTGAVQSISTTGLNPIPLKK